jgi:SAM-dependent methyltransferase
LPGELVKVRAYDEILETLDTNNKNRGLYFDAEEVPYCGKLLRVRCRVSRIVDERTGKLIPIKGNSVILDGAWCRGHYSDRRMYCPRAIFPIWRETWLERVEEPINQRYSQDGMGGPVPSIDLQRTFWDEWNANWRFRDPDYFMQRQLEVAQKLAGDLSLKSARILEAGSGTGWLSNGLVGYGAAVATDLSPASIEEGRRRYPQVDLRCGDFLKMDLPDGFDLIVSADALAHMHDQQAFFQRISGKLKEGGTFLLMTQNSFVWDRRSGLKRLGHGQLQRWPSLNEIRTLLAPDFEIEKIGSLVPGGDRGVLFWVENRYIRGAFGRLVGRKRWESWLEALRLGRELVIVARKRAAGARKAG